MLSQEGYRNVRIPQLIKFGIDVRAAIFIADTEHHDHTGPIASLERLDREPKLEGRVVTIARTGIRLVFEDGAWRIPKE